MDTSFRSVQGALKRSADYLEGELKCTSLVCVSMPMFELRCPKVDGRLLACEKGPAYPMYSQPALRSGDGRISSQLMRRIGGDSHDAAEHLSTSSVLYRTLW